MQEYFKEAFGVMPENTETENLATLYINDKYSGKNILVKKKRFNKNFYIDYENLLSTLSEYLSDKAFMELQKNLNVTQNNLVDSVNLNNLNYKVRFNKLRSQINIAIPKENLKPKTISLARNQRISTVEQKTTNIGTYSAFSNIRVQNIQNSLESMKQQYTLINLDGIINVDNIKFKYTLNNTKDVNNPKLTATTLFWEEFKHVNIHLGSLNTINNFTQNNNIPLMGINIQSKQKYSKNISFFSKSIYLEEQAYVSILVNGKKIGYIFLSEGLSHIKDIPLEKGLNAIEIIAENTEKKILWNKKYTKYTNNLNFLDALSLESYSLKVASPIYYDNNSLEINNDIQLIQTSLKGAGFNLPFRANFTVTNQNSTHTSYDINPINGVQFTQKIFNTNTEYGTQTYLSIYKNLVSNKSKINTFALSLHTRTNQFKDLNEYINNENIFFSEAIFTNLSGVNATINFEKIKTNQVSLGYSQSFTDNNILGSSIRIANTKDHPKLSFMDKSFVSIDFDLNKQTNQAIKLVYNTKIKIATHQVNFSYSNTNGGNFTIYLFWELGKNSTLQNSISSTDLSNSFSHINKTDNFRFNAQSFTNSDQTTLEGQIGHNNFNNTFSASHKKNISNPLDQIDSISYFNDIGRFTYNFNSSETNQQSQVSMSTAIAFADGEFALTKHINNNFLIIKPNKRISGANISINNNDSFILNRKVITNLPQDRPYKFNVNIKHNEQILMLQKTQYKIFSDSYKGQKIIIDTESTNIVLTKLLDSENSPISLSPVIFYEKSNPSKRKAALTNSEGNAQLIGLKSNTSYILDIKNRNLKPYELFIPKHVIGIHKIESIKFEKK